MPKKILNYLLYPHIALLICLVPISAAALILSMIYLGTESPLAIAAYVLSAYTLFAWCMRVPHIIGWAKRLRKENPYLRRWLGDERLRVTVSLTASLIFNTVYALFQLWLGIYHRTFWFLAFGIYYLLLALMRIMLARYTGKMTPGESIGRELVLYRITGGVLLGLDAALMLIVFFMVYFGRTIVHHPITVIALAAYTFTSLTLAIIGTVKYRKYNSPIYSATKAIGLASAAASFLTLESAMLTAFDDGTMGEGAREAMLLATGAAVVIFIALMAIGMLTRGVRRLTETNNEKDRNDG